MSETDELVIQGTFKNQDGSPIAGAAVHEVFLGNPPSNCGTVFDLEEAPAHTDDRGEFRLALSRLGEALLMKGPPGTWRRGCFVVLAVKDARTIGYVIASGSELEASPVCLAALSAVDIQGKVTDEAGQSIAGARAEVSLYLFFVGRGPCPEAPVNFWLSRRWEPVVDLVASTDEEGCFLIPRAPAMPGELRLTVSHPDFATLETPYFPYQPLMQLTMQPGTTIHLQLTPPAAGFGFILEGEPEGEAVSTHRDGTTDEAGRCALRSLPPGSYTIRYTGGAKGTWAVPAVVVMNLAKGEQRTLTATAVEGSVLCGRVLKAGSDEPIFHAEVRFESEAYPNTASTFQAAYTDARGAFTFGYAVAPGPFEVRVSAWKEGKPVGRRHKIVVGREPRTEMTFHLPLR